MKKTKYTPYTKKEYDELKAEMKEIGTFLPSSKMSYIWHNYTKIENSSERQPCSCKSAAGSWYKAVTRIQNFINGIERNAG